MILGYGGDCPKCKGSGTIVFRSRTDNKRYLGVCSLCCGTTWMKPKGTCRSETLKRVCLDTEPTYPIDRVTQLRLPE